ncbi:hypothetical protein BKA60DRAFT_687463 [Fusarium oxysporum]|nr:hypothetical protein BKA60DRAFT_687463 [Fusarium oxysporum]
MNAEFNTGTMNSLGHALVDSNSRLQVGNNYTYNYNQPNDNQCLTDLRSTDPRYDKARIEQAKGGLLGDSYKWILNNADFQQWRNDEQSRLLWIKGDPGKGKTMLLCGIINELEKQTQNLVSYFFCQGTDSRINNATAVLRGLIYMLVSKQPSLILHVREKYDHAGKDVFKDVNAWWALSEIFSSILQDPSLENMVLIIDALDECETDLSKLLNLIVQQSSLSQVKWIVSSRNWPSIEEQLETASISTAVGIYIRHKVDQLARLKKYDKETRDAVQYHLSSNANDTFLWVALACQDLEKITRWNTLAKLKAFPPGLDSLYKRMMEQICNSDDSQMCTGILALLTIVYRPITLHELTSFVDVLEGVYDDLESLVEIVGLCGSFLTVRNCTIYFVHQSAKDYLSTKEFQAVFPAGAGKVHYSVFSRSLQIMSENLRRDMYDLHHPGTSIDDVSQPEPDPLASARYSCIYWVDHLSDVISHRTSMPINDLQEDGRVHQFLSKKYLYWLEALSLLGGMTDGVVAMTKLEALLKGLNGTYLFDLVRDARLFILSHGWAIGKAPLQAYASALIFSPRRSITRLLFEIEEPAWIIAKPTIAEDWNACLLTLEGHNGSVYSVALSPNGQSLASTSDDGTFKIWDAITGYCKATLKGHSDRVLSVFFSPCGQRLASASFDRTIKIWDIKTGHCHATFKGHSDRVKSVVFSPDGQRLASASEDKTVKIWDATTGRCEATLEGHGDSVHSVAFSPDGQCLASASDDGILKIWDATTGRCQATFEGHSITVRSVAFSPDGQRLASASDDRTVKIWDVTTGRCEATLEGHGDSVHSVAFSPDGRRLTSVSGNGTVKIWLATTGRCEVTLEGHSDWVDSVAFSPDGRHFPLVLYDAINTWDSLTGHCQPTIQGHGGWRESVTFSPDGQRLALASEDWTVKIWDVTGRCEATLEGHDGRVYSVVFSPDGQRLASASEDETIKIWDVTTDGSQAKTSAALPASGSLHHPCQHHTYGISADRVWITYQGQNLLWLRQSTVHSGQRSLHQVLPSAVAWDRSCCFGSHTNIDFFPTQIGH